MTSTKLRILVPLDGSPAAESVLPVLMPLFRTTHVRLTLLGIAPSEDLTPPLDLYLTRLRISMLLDEVLAESKADWGNPADEILRAATRDRFDLVAMTTHGRTGLSRDLLGSVTETVLRGSEIPLLAYRPGEKIGDWNRIVVALDGSAAAEAALRDATELARVLGASLHLVSVKSPRSRLTIHPEDAFPVPEEDPQPYLDAMADGLAAKGILAVAETRTGDTAEELRTVAQKLDAGLLCLGTHGRTGYARKLLGSVAESVLRAAPCPVLLHPAAKPAALHHLSPGAASRHGP